MRLWSWTGYKLQAEVRRQHGVQVEFSKPHPKRYGVNRVVCLYVADNGNHSAWWLDGQNIESKPIIDFLCAMWRLQRREE